MRTAKGNSWETAICFVFLKVTEFVCGGVLYFLLCLIFDKIMKGRFPYFWLGGLELISIIAIAIILTVGLFLFVRWNWRLAERITGKG